MEVNSHSPKISLVLDTANKKIELNSLPDAIATTLPTELNPSNPPSTIVEISDQGLELVKQAQAEAIDTYVEKSDEEYARMSYEGLIDERDGGKDNDWTLGRATSQGIRLDGKAAQAANVRLAMQQGENGMAALSLRHSLDDFKSDVLKANPELSKASFDISFVDGKPKVTSKDLPMDAIATIQGMLDDKNNSIALKLKNDIGKYNDAALKTINMQIYDEKGRYGGQDSKFVHRNESLSMEEFSSGISYTSVADSEGGYTYQKHSEIVGSTSYGGNIVLKS